MKFHPGGDALDFSSPCSQVCIYFYLLWHILGGKKNVFVMVFFWNRSSQSPTSYRHSSTCVHRAFRGAETAGEPTGCRTSVAIVELCCVSKTLWWATPSQGLKISPDWIFSHYCSCKPSVLPNASEFLDQYPVSNGSFTIHSVGSESCWNDFRVPSSSKNLFTESLAWQRSAFIALKLPVVTTVQ